MSPQLPPMKNFRMRSRIQAVRIDNLWLRFLLYEKKLSSAKIGDYYLIGIDGAPQLMSAEGFERLFEEADAT